MVDGSANATARRGTFLNTGPGNRPPLSLGGFYEIALGTFHNVSVGASFRLCGLNRLVQAALVPAIARERIEQPQLSPGTRPIGAGEQPVSEIACGIGAADERATGIASSFVCHVETVPLGGERNGLFSRSTERQREPREDHEVGVESTQGTFLNTGPRRKVSLT